MANLKEIRNRIGSVSSTMQITSAMKMVSAAKLKKAQDAITAMRPYSNKLTQMLVNLSSSTDFESPHELDTDKFDYLQRDTKLLGLPYSIDFSRILMQAHVINNKLC